MADDHGTGLVPGSDFDLGNPVGDRQLTQQLRQGLEQMTEAWMEDPTVTDVGDEAALRFAESDQHAALALDPARAQSGSATIEPGIAGQRFEPASGTDLTQTLKILDQTMVLPAPLRLRTQMLEGTAPAVIEPCTFRNHAVDRGIQNLHGDSLVVAPGTVDQTCLNRFLGQRPVDENGLAVAASHAASVVGKVAHLDFDRLDRQLAASTSSHPGVRARIVVRNSETSGSASMNEPPRASGGS